MMVVVMIEVISIMAMSFIVSFDKASALNKVYRDHSEAI